MAFRTPNMKLHTAQLKTFKFIKYLQCHKIYFNAVYMNCVKT